MNPLDTLALRPHSSPKTLYLAAMACSMLLLAGCASVSTDPFSDEAIRQQSEADLLAAQQGVAPITGPIGLEEALARALKFNLDRRTRLMEEAIALNQLDAISMDKWPKVMASAGYTSRSELELKRSRNSVSGVLLGGEPTISSDTDHSTSNLGLTWNLLDFGLASYNESQTADRALIASERRRKAMHILIQDVRTAFWRAACAQKLQSAIKTSINQANQALADAKKSEDEKLRAPLEAMRYQRGVLESLRMLEAIEQELSSAKIELASLINAPLSSQFRVSEPANLQLNTRMLEMPVSELEALAIQNNADQREHHYNSRIAATEARKTLLKLFPNISFNYSLQYDSDKYLVNNHWNDAGMQLSFNLMNLLTAPAQQRLADAGVALANQRRIAGLLATLTQVHLSRLQYANAVQQLSRAKAIDEVDARIGKTVADREASQSGSKLESVAANTASVLSQLRHYQALAQAHAAASKFQATLGVEPQLSHVEDKSLSELTDSIQQEMNRWEKGELNALDDSEPAIAPAIASADTTAQESTTADLAPASTPAPVLPTAPTAAQEETTQPEQLATALGADKTLPQ